MPNRKVLAKLDDQLLAASKQVNMLSQSEIEIAIGLKIRQIESCIDDPAELSKLKSFEVIVDLFLRFLSITLSTDPVMWLTEKERHETDRLRKERLRVARELYTEQQERKASASRINDMYFPEWFEPDTATFRAGFSFEDPSGEPRLSPAQQRIFGSWKRPKELFQKPTIILDPKGSVAGSDLQQSSCVTNCSLVSSLLIMAQQEPKKKGFATQMLYPKNSKGMPVISANGRYHVRLFWNGSPRTVIVDDLLPVDRKGQLICVKSLNQGELWATLIEKAYLKLVVGGYDFWTGSNSGIDLYALTGWPPESLTFQPSAIYKKKDTKAFQDDLWAKLIRGMKIKDNLVTACTRPDISEDATGLPRSHAFAILDARDDNETHERRLLLRNPWGRNAEEFWMTLEEMPKYFGSAHVNWNIDLFSHVSHHMCTLSVHEQHDLVGFHRTVQYRINVSPDTKLVWILLSRHIHSAAGLESVENALACHAFDTKNRVLFPEQEKILFKGHYSTGPHSLCRVESVSASGSFVVVLSAYNARKPVRSTLSVFSSSQVTTVEVLPPTLFGIPIIGESEFILDVADQVAPIWTLKLPPETSAAYFVPEVKLRASIYPKDGSCERIEFDLIVLDVKARRQKLLGSSDATSTTKSPSRSSRVLLQVETIIPNELLGRSSVRVLITPRIAVGTPDRKSIKYVVEIDCDLPCIELSAPDNPTQQGLLRQMLDTFKTI